ncbi:MAG TPA: HD domain-containing response regulator [Candidatus Acidoferrum sp.]|nr:HD domain-containing response regulator [Candidatus Acidoferrum sp.]
MSASANLPAPGPRRSVLVVDDDQASRTYLAEALEALGCRVLQTADGGEALRILTEESLDLICTDLMMPGMDGLEFLHLARVHAPGLPLVLVTACDQAEVAAEALQGGAACFLRKPVSLADLTAILDGVPIPGRPLRPAGVPGPLNGSAGSGEAAAGPEAAPGGGVPGLDPALLRKTTQLSLLTRFGAALGGVKAGAPGSRLDPAQSAGAPGRGEGSGFAPLVQRSLDFILRAMLGERAALVLTEGEEVQPIATRGWRDHLLPLRAMASRLGGTGDGHAWHGVLEEMPLVAAPLTIQGAGVGLICVGRDPGAAAFTFADAELLTAFSAQTGVVLENACLAKQLERAFQETVTSLVVTLEARHKYTEGHSLRVSRYAAGIAETLGLPEGLREQVGTASLLHDLGKVGVRDAILDKPGRLTPDEWTLMRQHPVLGSKILGPLGFLAEEARSVCHHHERYDGAGYPDGLAGEAIPLPSRIIAVADSFDAMSTARPYRPPLPVPEALAELGRGAGSQFDPKIVAAFLAWYAAAAADRAEAADAETSIR